MNPFKNITDELRQNPEYQKAAARHQEQKPKDPPDTKTAKQIALGDWLDGCFYDRARKEVLVLDAKGDWFAVNETQLRRQCKCRGMAVKPSEDDPASPFDRFLVKLQDTRGIHFAGPLAGHSKGLRYVNGLPVLITSSPRFIQPAAGDWPTIQSLITGMFTDGRFDQTVYFYGWLKMALESLTNGAGKPGQVLVLAGPAEAGKSLLQSIITWCFGGRESKPYAYMTGRTDFNADLFGSEHLRLDDEQASTDMRARKAFGARIKELLFGQGQRLHAKHRDAITLDPIWRMTVSLNEEPESMQVLPPLDESLEDKLMILRITKRPMPMPTATTEQQRAFSDRIKSELPAFIHWLANHHEITPEMRNERCGIRHWHHPELMAAIRELSPESRLLSLIDMTVNASPFWEGTAEELERTLTCNSSSVRQEASKLLYWNNACGTYLGRLARDEPTRVEKVRTHESRAWRILPPEYATE
jgi:hypothetical protein